MDSKGDSCLGNGGNNNLQKHKVEAYDVNLFCLSPPFVNWTYFVPKCSHHLIYSEKKLKAAQETLDFYVISEEYKLYNHMRLYIIASLAFIVISLMATFQWTRVLRIPPFSSNELFLFFMQFSLSLLWSLFMFKWEWVSFSTGRKIVQYVLMVLVTTVLCLTGGKNSPILISLFAIVSVFSGTLGVPVALFSSAFIGLLCTLFYIFPELNVSYVDPEYQAVSHFMENYVSTLILAFNIYLNDINLKREKDTLENSVVYALNADKTKSFFLASTAHEMRTPLHHINLLNNLLAGKITQFLEESSCAQLCSQYQELLEYANQGKSATKLLLNLINDALDVSKIEAGGLTVQNDCIAIEKTIMETFEMFRPEALERDIAYTCTFEENTKELLVFADNLRLVQILTNLLGNAFKFTENEEAVKVTVKKCKLGDPIAKETGFYKLLSDESTVIDCCEPIGIDNERGEDMLCVSVRDSGIGISKDALGSIFSPFTQVDGVSTTRKYRGSGLGLAITQKLAKLMGAEVSVESKPSTGSIFSIYFKIITKDSVALEKSIKATKVEDNSVGATTPAYTYNLRRRSSQPTPLSPKGKPQTTKKKKKKKGRYNANDADEDDNDNCYSSENDNRNIDNYNNNNSNSNAKNNNGNAKNNNGNAKNNNGNQTTVELSRRIGTSKKSSKNSDLSKRLTKKSSTSDVHNKIGINKQLNGINVIVCDDNVVSLKLLSTLLGSFGAKVVVTSSPLELLGLFEKSISAKKEQLEHWILAFSTDNNTKMDFLPECMATDSVLLFDVLLLDLYMPVMDGFDVAKRIRELEAEVIKLEAQLLELCCSSSSPISSSFWVSYRNFERMHIVALSATSRVEDMERALNECQMNQFMNKPFELPDIKKTLIDIKQDRNIKQKERRKSLGFDDT